MNSINTMDSITIKKNPQEIENYNYLLLSIYFYLKHNNYNSTADILFSEGNLENIFKFPQDIKEISNEKEKLIKNFIQYFYYNSYFKFQNSFDIFGDFWEQFWVIFSNKIKQGNKAISQIDNIINQEKNNLKLTYNDKTYH